MIMSVHRYFPMYSKIALSKPPKERLTLYAYLLYHTYVEKVKVKSHFGKKKYHVSAMAVTWHFLNLVTEKITFTADKVTNKLFS